MPKLILPSEDLRRIIRRRRHLGIDQRDEVWNGVYVVSPGADNEPQQVGRWLANAFEAALGDKIGHQVFHGTNISAREDDWRKNYRVPDVAVFLAGNPAVDRRSHWLGGPDFAVEVMSRGDRSRKKFDFCGAVGVKELLLVDRKAWQLELYRFVESGWRHVGKVGACDEASLLSETLGLDLRLIAGDRRPMIEVTRPDGAGRWLA